jgi:(R,R)-butanediol dehydrogenase/meso-butanediol dehydrogenase/diacetyl reductase
MKAAVFKSVGRPLALEDRPDPKPLRGEVVIKVGRCGICSSDLHKTSGHGVSFPGDTILGHEYAGEVVAIGAGVSTLKAGDRITAMPMAGCGVCAGCLRGFPLACSSMQPMMSGYAEYARACERFAVKLPSSLSLADGALIEPLASSLHGVAMAGLRADSNVAVLGAGAIGLGAIYWAKRMGARRIVAIARSERHKELATHMGATHFLAGDDDPAQNLAGMLGRLPETVFECVGMPGSLASAIDIVAPQGTIVVLGQCTVADSLTPFVAGVKGVVMRFSAAYELRDFETAADAMDRGAVEPRAMVTETISLGGLPEIFEQMRKSPRGCKVLVAPSTG